MKTYINGIGALGGFGCGIHELLDCLNGGSGPLPSSAGEVDSEEFYPAYTADTSYLDSVIPKRALRRIDHFSRLGLTGAWLALNDSGLDSLDKHSTGLVICSGYGSANTTFSFLDSMIDYGDSCASPTLFSSSVHNAAAGHISMLFGLEGPNLTVSQFEMSVPSGLLSAIQWLKEERVERVLFGALDEYCDVLGYCYQRYYGRSGNVKLTPLEPGQQSAVPGEGAVFFLLSNEKSATVDYGYIDSVGIGSINDEKILLPESSFYILNADGHKECDMGYSAVIPRGSSVSCYTPLYGSTPTGTAFDVAIGALSFKLGRLFSSPQSVGHLENHRILMENSANDRNNISCVKVGRHGGLSVITLSKS